MTDTKKLLEDMFNQVSDIVKEREEEFIRNFIIPCQPSFRVWDFESEVFYYSSDFDNLSQFFTFAESLKMQNHTFAYQQSLGLSDLNNKLMYHGDIVELTDAARKIFDIERKFVLVGIKEGSAMYSHGFYQFGLDRYLWMIARDGCKECTVRSNIFENPELLGKEGYDTYTH